MKYYLKSVDETLKALETSKKGVTNQEAEKRIAQNGKNELDKAKKKKFIVSLFEQILNPMVLILLAAAVLSIIIALLEHGEAKEYAEAGIILLVVILNSLLGVFQESKAEKAIEALKGLTSKNSKVRRDGNVLEIASADIVLGDIVLIEAGDLIPADMRLIVSANLKIEEAQLTGESVPTEKMINALKAHESDSISLGDRTNMAYMGSSVSYGRGEGVVTAIGMQTEVGKIAKIIQETKSGETPLQKRLSELSKILSFLVLGICVVIFIIKLITADEFNTDVVLGSFMLAVSLAVAAIPEGLAAVVTIVLSIGVTNMAKKNAVIRKLTAVETLGCAQIICSDKTGTLTQNKMTVVDSYGDEEMLIKAMALCSDSEIATDGKIVGDPTENALVAFALKNGFDKNKLKEEYPRVNELPFDSVRKMMTTIHNVNNKCLQFTKGAPDEILKVCKNMLVNGKIVPLNEKLIKEISAKNKEYADKALRVLACAYLERDEFPAKNVIEEIENNLVFVGLEAMIDPVRPEVKDAVKICKLSGIKVVMITGDHKETASAIAKELEIISDASQAMTGKELDTLSDEEFAKRIENTFVYARVQPEHKVRIVNMWKEKGFITAMTGDGVNDAPAIKSGDIGIGMGITGTDVTKNVADMVLADDNFATIISAVEEGRRIYDNIKKTIQFLLSSNLSEVVSILIATLMGFVLFKPVHLLFINLVTDSLPAVALGMEKAEEDIMKRKPREKTEGIFSDGLGIRVIYQGIIIALLTLSAYWIVDGWDDTEVAMSSAFFTMSMCEIFHAYNLRSINHSIFKIKKRNNVMFGAMLLSLVLTLLIIYVPFLASVFSLKPLTAKELLVSFLLSFSIIPIMEIAKIIENAIRKNKDNKLKETINSEK